MPWHTFLYARKSTEEEDRQILSLDAQEKECRSYAERQGLAISEIIRESHSARKPGRPQFETMLKKTERLRKQDVSVRILCHKPDRLLRNLPDWARVNDLLESGIDLAFVTGSYPNNAQGKMMFGVNVLFAKYYVDNLSEEVRKGMNEKVAQGGWPAPAPLGYRNANGRIEIEPECKDHLRHAFEYYASGEYSLATLADRLYEEGLVGRRHGRKLSKGFLQDHVLTNPFYCGLLRYRGSIYQGSHQPLVSVALFERVKARLEGRGIPKRIQHDFRYKGIFECAACGCAVIGEIKKGRYIYYRCTHKRGNCTEGYVRQEFIDINLQAQLRQTITLPNGAIQALQEAAEVVATAGNQDEKTVRLALDRRSKEIESRQKTLLDLRLLGHLTNPEYLAKREELMMEQGRTTEQLARFELPKNDVKKIVEAFIHACNGFDNLLKHGDDQEIRELLRIVGSNFQIGAKNVSFHAQKPFNWAVEYRDRPLWWTEGDVARTFVRELMASYSDLTIASPS